MKNMIEKLRKDDFFRALLFMAGSAIFNLAYGIFSLVVGIIDKSPYMLSSSVYYLVLAFGEGFLIIRRQKTKSMRYYGFLLLILDLALSFMTFYTLLTGRNVSQNEIIMITIALYSFVKMGMAISNLLKARHSKDRYILIMRSISFSCALVGILTLTMSMVATFAEGGIESAKELVIGTGLGIFILNLLLAVYLIIDKTDLFQKRQQKAD